MRRNWLLLLSQLDSSRSQRSVPLRYRVFVLSSYRELAKQTPYGTDRSDCDRMVVTSGSSVSFVSLFLSCALASCFRPSCPFHAFSLLIPLKPASPYPGSSLYDILVSVGDLLCLWLGSFVPPLSYQGCHPSGYVDTLPNPFSPPYRILCIITLLMQNSALLTKYVFWQMMDEKISEVKKDGKSKSNCFIKFPYPTTALGRPWLKANWSHTRATAF